MDERKMKTKMNFNFEMEELKMRKAPHHRRPLVVFGTTAIAQSPANVEKARCFRTNKTKSNLVSTASAQEIKVQKQREWSNDIPFLSLLHSCRSWVLPMRLVWRMVQSCRSWVRDKI